MVNDVEYKVLYLLESGYKIDAILKELNIEEENLAEIIIDLDNRDFIKLENKNWILLQQGKDILKGKKEEFIKKLKIDYMHGNISKQEFSKKSKELEIIARGAPEDDTSQKEEIVLKKEESISQKKEEKKNCPKCGKENKPGSKYCFKCGEPLNK